jgi:hypothetical protein
MEANLKLLVLSDAGCACGIVPHMEYEGHSVTITSTNPTTSSTYTVAIADSASYSVALEKLQKQGTRILGVSNWTNLIDTNDKYRNDLIKAIGYKPADISTKGDHVIVSTWFNGNEFIAKFVVFNYRPMLTDNLGVMVPSAGYVAYFGADDSALLTKVCKPLEKFLRKVSHQGTFSIECICNEEGIFVSDISASMQVPYPHLIYEMVPHNKTSILTAVIDERSKPLAIQAKWAAGVMVSVYPYPYAKPDKPVIIHGLSQANIKHSWLMDLVKENGEWICGNRSGCLGYLVARGDSYAEAGRRVYRTLKHHISAKNLQYRTDIGKDIADRYARLRKLNLLKEEVLDGKHTRHNS